ncbi:MAG: GNAT family protein [Chloroflexota bacterium]
MIFGKRIRLRGVEKEDLPLFVKWLNDPEVIEGLMFFQPLSYAEEIRWFENLANLPASEHPLAIEIQDGENWRMIGDCGFHNISQINRSAEVGIFIGDKVLWNKGYGTETMQLLLKYGFESLNLNRISLVVYDDNPRALRAYEKAGFVLEGRRRQAKYKHGRYGDELLMSILRSEWDAKQLLEG